MAGFPPVTRNPGSFSLIALPLPVWLCSAAPSQLGGENGGSCGEFSCTQSRARHLVSAHTPWPGSASRPHPTRESLGGPSHGGLLSRLVGAEPASPFQGHLRSEGGGRTPGVTFRSLCSGRVKSGNNSVCDASCISPGRLSCGECNCLRNAMTNVTVVKSRPSFLKPSSHI